MKKLMKWGRLALVAAVSLSNVAPVLAVTSARSQTANFNNSSHTSAGTAILLRNDEQITYTSVNGTDPNVNQVTLQKSCDGSNFGGLDVAISTTNNSAAGTYTATVYVENCPGGKVWYRWFPTSYTSGASSTTIAEVDNTLRSFYNNQRESVLDINDGGIQSNGYLNMVGSFRLHSYTKAQIDALTPAYAGEHITCSDCNFAYNTCVASGTSVAQWYALKTSTGGVNVNGGTHQNGCGTGQ